MRKRANGRPGGLPGQIALVLQGVGAQGAHQMGVCEALHDSGIEPDWIIGTSVGAITGAIAAGNPPAARRGVLRDFWSRIAADAAGGGTGPDTASVAALVRGARWASTPDPAAGRSLPASMPTHPPRWHPQGALAHALEDLVDFTYLNAAGPRLTVGAVHVRSGELRWFDTAAMALASEHVLASCALPPAFAGVRVDGELYWDGGIHASTAIEAAFDDSPRRDTVVFAVQPWSAAGGEPGSIWAALGRRKEIQHAGRADSQLRCQAQVHRMRHMIRDLLERLPANARDDPEVAEIACHGCSTRLHVVRLIAPEGTACGPLQDAALGAAAIESRRAAGYQLGLAAAAAQPWRQGADPRQGVLLHEFRAPDALAPVAHGHALR
ncbi:MAG: patatin-like phospholipase family protein [Pseudomonadota bacterium]